jgi:hypothetical protein
MHVSRLALAALLTAAVAAGPARGVVSTEAPAALLVFPLISVDGNNGIDTLIQLTNTDEAAVGVRCDYHASTGRPEFRAFDLQLAANQPVAWHAAAGRDADAVGAVPALGSAPFTGVLRCAATGAGGAPAARNVLVGDATIQRSSNTPRLAIDASHYNATGFDALAGALNGDQQLTLGGAAAEYAACPESLLFQTFFDGATIDLGADGSVQHRLATTLALASCAQSTTEDSNATISVVVTNELGTMTSTIIALHEQLVTPISLIDTTAPDRSIFSFAVQQTLTGTISLTPVGGTGALGVAIQTHADPSDATRASTVAIQPQLSGERSTADVIDLPPVTPTAAPTCAGDCDHDGKAEINELVTGVNIALGTQAIASCPAFDGDMSGTVSIGELITAVNNALRGCP